MTHPTRLPRHDPQRQRPPAIRQLLHRRRHRLHFWPLRPVVVRRLRHSVDWARIYHRQRTGIRRKLCLLCLQQGKGHGNSWRGFDISGSALASVCPCCFPEQRVERCCQPRRLGRLEWRQCHGPCLLQGVSKYWGRCRPVPASGLQWCSGGGCQDHRHPRRKLRGGGLG